MIKETTRLVGSENCRTSADFWVAATADPRRRLAALLQDNEAVLYLMAGRAAEKVCLGKCEGGYEDDERQISTKLAPRLKIPGTDPAAAKQAEERALRRHGMLPNTRPADVTFDPAYAHYIAKARRKVRTLVGVELSDCKLMRVPG
jgi:hypothetical protein